MIAFVIASTKHGPLIVNRLDFHVQGEQAYGVGGQLLQTSSYQPAEVQLALGILKMRKMKHGDGVVALDCGANIGVHAISWSREMDGWGSVIAIEPQERLYYALAGNIALNNCFNARAICAAVSSESGLINVPVLDYQVPSSFGSLELLQHPDNESIGQPVDYTKVTTVKMITIDELALPRVDFIKIDVQRMEMQVLEGAADTIKRCHPDMLIEKTDVGEEKISQYLAKENYKCRVIDAENVLAIWHP